ncbi:hypothetical protein BJV82DRAFT_590923 [Fennellomyces sp. T-0311]|nr:hypothetical protein BJV82DRAFT_590923 [Fennellomyces sp. T-0311]
MVSCPVNGAETRALGQVKAMLDSTVHTLFPDHQVTWERFEGDLDVADLEKDEEQQKEDDPKDKKDKRFQAVDAACAGLLFFRFRINVKPSEYVTKLIENKDQLDANKLRHCSRFVPLDYICPATTDRIPKCFERLREQELDPIKTKTTIAIVTEIRNNISLKKPDVIQMIAPMIPEEHFKVDLKNPDLVIFVSVFKSVCGMSVLPNYYSRKKYNLLALMEKKNSDDGKDA